MTDEERIKIRKKKKRKKRAKGFLLAVAFLVIALAVFLITVKVAKPDFEIKSILPEKVYTFVDEDILGNTTTTTTLPPTTTETTTTKPAGYYLPIEEFTFESDRKGNLLGNILGGGKAWRDSTYIYHIVDCDGIYRFYPPSETYTKIYSSSDYLSNLNVTEEYIYFRNDTDHQFYALKKGETTAQAIASNVKTAYIYADNLYYVTENNELCIMNLEKKEQLVLYSSSTYEVKLIGISLGRVYFSAQDGNGKISFLTVDNENKEKAVPFKEPVSAETYSSFVMEDGFLYYFMKNDDGTYDLYRQKFGSEQTVKLIESAAVNNYPIVEMNRLFYAHREGDTFMMKELNMNSNAKKVLLTVSSVTDENSLIFQHGGTYDFIIGYRNPKSWIYFSSCINTGSTNVMMFKNGEWSY